MENYLNHRGQLMVMESVLKNKKQPSHVVLKDIKVSIFSFAYYDMQLILYPSLVNSTLLVFKKVF